MKKTRIYLSLCLILLLVVSLCVPTAMASSDNSRRYLYDNYSVYYDSEMNESWSTLSGYLSTAEDLLYDNFDINLQMLFSTSSSRLNQLDGCTLSDSNICTSQCGALTTCNDIHHKSGYYFLDQVDAYDAKIFRFVDFATCRYKASASPAHGVIYGATSADDSDIIVSLFAPSVQRTTVHELSHWYGAQDNQCVDGQDCVMRYGTTVYNKWCDNCEEDMIEYLLGF